MCFQVPIRPSYWSLGCPVPGDFRQPEIRDARCLQTASLHDINTAARQNAHGGGELQDTEGGLPVCRWSLEVCVPKSGRLQMLQTPQTRFIARVPSSYFLRRI